MVFSDAIPQLLALIQTHGVLAVITAVVIEEVIAPIPSQPIVMGAAFLLVGTQTSVIGAAPPLFLYVVLPAAVAGTLSSYVWFGVAYYGGKPAVTRFQNVLQVSWEDIEDMETTLEEKRWDAGFVGVLRAIPVIPVIAVTVAGGMIRMNPVTYGLATFTGMLIRNSVLAYLGWQGKALYEEYAAVFSQVETVVLVGIIAVAAAVFFVHRRRKEGQP